MPNQLNSLFIANSVDKNNSRMKTAFVNVLAISDVIGRSQSETLLFVSSLISYRWIYHLNHVD